MPKVKSPWGRDFTGLWNVFEAGLRKSFRLGWPFRCLWKRGGSHEIHCSLGVRCTRCSGPGVVSVIASL